MINKNLYDKTVSILVESYFNDTLEHGYCWACAVGNIIASNMGLEVNSDKWTAGCPKWQSVFVTSDVERYTNPDMYKNVAKLQIDSTGYTWQELSEIEYAFETAPTGETSEDWMFNGLMSVIETLDIIHENTDTELTTTSKARFNKSLV